MKRLIDELPIGPFRVALFETDEPLNEGDALAMWDPEKLEIVLDVALTGLRRWSVLMHELFHALSDLYDLETGDEHVCTALGNGLTQALARYLPAPPASRPPVYMDDEPTPTVEIPNLFKGGP